MKNDSQVSLSNKKSCYHSQLTFKPPFLLQETVAFIAAIDEPRTYTQADKFSIQLNFHYSLYLIKYSKNTLRFLLIVRDITWN